MNRMLLKAILLIFLLLDTAYSFVQHYQMPLDGDMAAIILPCKDYQHVLDDPLGMGVLLNGEQYPGPNRFFAHWGMSAYFKSVPFVFQHFVTPIDSIYLSCALFKTLVQVFLILLISMYICCFSFNKGNLLLAAALITPLFQTFGYSMVMGIIDHSITYAFFYGLPVGLMFLFLFPFFKAFVTKKHLKFNILTKILLIFLAVVLALSGPLAPGMALILCPMLGIFFWREQYISTTPASIGARLLESFKRIPAEVMFYFGLLMTLCLYSLYIGQSNSENQTATLHLWTRFAKMPQGIFEMFTNKIGPPLLLSGIIINALIINNQKRNPQSRILLKLIWMVALFSVIYIPLLPFGGYREYRPNIVRYDTLLPVTISLIFVFGLTACFILKKVVFNNKKFYFAGILAFMLIFTIADKTDWGRNSCERSALETLAKAPTNVVFLENDCTVLAWKKIGDSQSSENVAQLLELWGIASPKRQFYQK